MPMTPPLFVTPLYAGLLAVLFIALSVRTIGQRRRHQVAVGDAGHPALLRAMRAHANFAEYAPLALLLVAINELNAAPAWLLHACAGLLLLGRLLHAWGISQVKEDFRFRVSGMTLTFTSIGTSALALLSTPLWRSVA